MKTEIISETPLTMAQLKAELDQIRKRDKEFGIRSTKTEEYLSKFVKIDAKKSEEFAKKLEELNIPRLKPEHIAKIIDLLPATPDELKNVLQGYIITISAENLNKIADVVSNYK